jgi:hypothetical protein
VHPEINTSIYTNNGSYFKITGVDLDGSGNGELVAIRTSGTNLPAASGTLTKYSGNGDATISFSSQSLEAKSGTITARRTSGTGNPSASGTLTKVSGTGDATISFSSQASDFSAYEFTWKDLFDLVVGGWNAFVRIRPYIASGTPDYLTIDIDIIPKTEAAIDSAITDVTWIERKLIKRKFEIDGISIQTDNYNYELGAKAGYINSKTLEIATQNIYNSNWEDALNIGITAQYTGGGYDYQQPDDFFYNAGGGDPFIKQWYENQIGATDGYTGKVYPIYDDGGGDDLVRILDQLEFDAKTIQINTIRIGNDRLMEIEGIVI